MSHEQNASFSQLKVAAISDEPTQPFRLGYRAWLDALRGIAVLLVIGHHFVLIPNGTLGVDMFFVLSGFLITTLLMEEFSRTNSISLPKFYARRALRLLPLLYALLISYLVYAYLFQSDARLDQIAREAIVVATYTVNLRMLHGIPIHELGHTWTLCVEEHFYLLWPLALIAMLKLRFRRLSIMVTLLVAICSIVAWRAYLYSMASPTASDWIRQWFRIYIGSDTRADGLLVGCMLGLIATWNLLPTSKTMILGLRILSYAATCTLLACVFVVPWWHPSLFYGLYTAIAGLVALSIAGLLVDTPKFFTNSQVVKSFAGIGKISYGLYIIHLPVMHWFDSRFGWHDLSSTCAALVITFALAISSYLMVEKPFLQLKKHFAYRKFSEVAKTKVQAAEEVLILAPVSRLPDSVRRAA